MRSNIIECSSLQDLIENIKSHNCSPNSRIINWDRSENPSIFKIGFRCTECRKVWSLGLSALKKSTKDLPDEGLSLIREYNELAKNKQGQIMCNDFINALIHKF